MRSWSAIEMRLTVCPWSVKCIFDAVQRVGVTKTHMKKADQAASKAEFATKGSRRVAVVGAGIGGLAAAIRLACTGFAVDLYEAQTAVGGKMRQIQTVAGPVDAGPTVFTMRWAFDELVEGAGRSLDDLVQLRPLERLARHAWTDGTQLDLYRDTERSAAEISRVFGPNEADGYRRFSSYAADLYSRVEGPFLRATKPGLGSAWRAGGFSALMRMMGVDWQRSMWRAIGGFFAEPKLRQLFARYATYYGSSPFAAPATLNLIADVERAGVWTLEGGIYALADALAELARSLGVEIRLGNPVERLLVRGGRVAGLADARGEHPYDAVVFNGAVDALASGRLGPEVAAAVPAPKGPRSLSAITWAMATETRGFDLDFHNVFFSDDYTAEFEALFERGTPPASPTVYVCAQDRVASGSVDGLERLLVLSNAPARGDESRPNEEEIERCERASFELLARCGLQLRPEPERGGRTSPSDFERLFPATGGALYGAATHGPFAAFKRPTARTKLAGLYLAGGSAHPGAGVPMVSLSGQIAADAVGEDLPSTRASSRVATSGGTSTPSPRVASTP